MLQKVGDSGAQCLTVLFVQFVFFHTAMMLQCADRCHDNDSRRLQPCHTAFDIQEFLGSQVGTESCLGNCIFAKLHCDLCRSDAVASVSDVCEGAAVHECRSSFQRLHQVGLQRIFQQCRHGTRCL